MNMVSTICQGMWQNGLRRQAFDSPNNFTHDMNGYSMHMQKTDRKCIKRKVIRGSGRIYPIISKQHADPMNIRIPLSHIWASVMYCHFLTDHQ